MNINLREYQASAADHIINYAVENIRGKLLVVGPPGSGKTVIYAHVLRTLAAEQGLRGLAWAHRRELIGQAYDHLVEGGIPREMIGVIMAGDKRENPRAPIQVASVETLHRRTKPLADVIVSDEAHRDASDGRRKLRAMYPDAFHLGFTATPVRLDGRGLGGQGGYEQMYIVAQPSQLIAEGHIVAPKIYTVPPEMLPDLQGVRTLGGDYRDDDLEVATNKKALVGNVVDHWIRRAEGRRTMAFPVSVRHSRNVVARFEAVGIRAAHIDGDTPRLERERILAKLASGDIPIVSSCGVLSEGTNVPAVKCVLTLRATKSLALHGQQPGRAMRPWRNVEPLMLDHAGNTLRLGLPHADREWSLSEEKGKNGRGGVAQKACPSCHLVVAVACLKCPGCEAALAPPRAVEPTEKSGELVEYRATYTEEQKSTGLDHIRSFAAARGFPPEWVAKVYAAKFGERPTVVPNAA